MSLKKELNLSDEVGKKNFYTNTNAKHCLFDFFFHFSSHLLLKNKNISGFLQRY